MKPQDLVVAPTDEYNKGWNDALEMAAGFIEVAESKTSRSVRHPKIDKLFHDTIQACARGIRSLRRQIDERP